MKGMVAAIALLFTFGCSVPIQSSPEPIAPPKPSGKDIFLQVVHNEAPMTRNLNDADLVNLAGKICDAFDVGATFEEVAYVMLDGGLNANAAGVIIGASIAWKCPEQEEQL